MLTGMLHSLGFKQVTVNFGAVATGPAGPLASCRH